MHIITYVVLLVSCRSMASKTPVGFIGLGNMGTPMARNLLKHGYPVIATDVFPESCKELQDSGAQVCAELKHLLQLHALLYFQNLDHACSVWKKIAFAFSHRS